MFDTSYPRTIDSSAGQRMTFTRLVREAGREWVEARSEIAPGSGPMMHRHPHQDEVLTVVAGTLGYEIAGKGEAVAAAGESVAFARGTAHRFWNAGPDTLQAIGRISPPLRFEYFMTALYKSMSENGGRPGLFDAAYLTHHFAQEGEMVGIPSVIRQLVFPVVRRIGIMAGRYGRYQDAPAA